MEVQRPASITLAEGDQGFEMVVRWKRSSAIPIFLFVLIWNGLLSIFIALAAQAAWALVAVPAVPAALGLFILYGGIGHLFNKTTLRIARGVLTVKVRPLPFFQGKRLDTERIGRVYAKAQAHEDEDGRVTHSHHVNVRTKDGKELRLLSLLGSEAESRYIGQELERRLGVDG